MTPLFLRSRFEVRRIGYFRWAVDIVVTPVRTSTVAVCWTRRGARELARRLDGIFDYERRMEEYRRRAGIYSL